MKKTIPHEGVVAVDDVVNDIVRPKHDRVSGSPMDIAGVRDYESAVERATRALHGGDVKGYRACRSWHDVDRSNGPYTPPLTEMGRTSTGDFLHRYRDHYFHDIMHPDAPEGTQVPAQVRKLGVSGPVHLRIMHPQKLFDVHWDSGYCSRLAGGHYWPDFKRLRRSDYDSVGHVLSLMLRHHACRNGNVLGGKNHDVFGQDIPGDHGSWMRLIDVANVVAAQQQNPRSHWWRRLTKAAKAAGGVTNPLLVSETLRYEKNVGLNCRRSSLGPLRPLLRCSRTYSTGASSCSCTAFAYS